MLTWFLKTLLATTLIFLVAIIVIRARPYEVNAVQQVIAPAADCLPPCFMSIRLGVTSAEEAYTLLNNHPWVAEVIDDTSPVSDGAIPGISGDLFWTWSGSQPAWIDERRMGQVRMQRGATRFITVRTKSALGDVRLTLPKPDWEIMFYDRLPNDILAIHHRFAYRQMGVLFQTDRLPCPTPVLWQQPVTLTIWATVASAQSSGATGNVNAGCLGH